jgi:DNA repair protein SbcC/Rad50
MRILHLRMQNFRQHADTEIEFHTGLTGIIGPNGAGKSTILEAIAWAIYGAEATRGTNETLRFLRAGPRARVEVSLRLELGGHEYQVVRSLNGAEVFLDGGAAPVATTVGGVTRYLQSRLGMTRREFFNTYFTGQKELQFLAAMGTAERGRFLSQVLGYEQLRKAQELARTRRTELKHEITGLHAGMADPEQLRLQRADAEERLMRARQALADVETERAAAARQSAELAPRWAEAQTARERHRELNHRIETAQRDRESVLRDAQRVETELARVVQAEAEVAILREQLEPLPSLRDDCERMAELARVEERRKALAAQIADIAADLRQLDERLERVERAPELAERYAAELESLRVELRTVDQELDQRKTAWLRDSQDAQTKLQNYRDRGHELKLQIQQIREAGPEGQCPTCERPLGKDFERVLDELEEQWVAVVQDGKWWKSRVDQLEARPDDIVQLEARVAGLEAQVEEKGRKHAKCERAVQELAVLRTEHGQRTARRAELQQQLDLLPRGYDPEAHRAAEARLQSLRALETRLARLEEAAARRVELERQHADVHAREEEAAARTAAALAERQALGFDEPSFAALRSEVDAVAQRVHHLALKATELRGQLESAQQAIAAAESGEEQYRERMREAEAREDELRHHNELDAALNALRAELNAQVRPELSEIASAFLTQLTDGRYNALEIDDSYNLLLLDEGEEKPVISGGEEDVANLVLRLSLSQMIAERAGHPLSLLVLDEVFGSLDVARRDNVVQLLRRLEDRFEQVILITHIEGIREGLDRVLYVGFDERTGASRVQEVAFASSDEVLAADGVTR